MVVCVFGNLIIVTTICIIRIVNLIKLVYLPGTYKTLWSECLIQYPFKPVRPSLNATHTPYFDRFVSPSTTTQQYYWHIPELSRSNVRLGLVLLLNVGGGFRMDIGTSPSCGGLLPLPPPTAPLDLLDDEPPAPLALALLPPGACTRTKQ